MKNNQLLLFILILFCLFNCKTNSTTKNEALEERISKEEQLQKLYTTAIKPLFKKYKNTNIPNSFTVDSKDNSINAGASHNFLTVSQGLVSSKKEYIQTYVLAHEIAHIITLNQAELFGLQGAIPSGEKTNDYKKSEYLADLIAIHLIKKHLPKEFNLLQKDFVSLKIMLGNGDFMHPSGSKRVNMMKTYINDSLNKTPSSVFENIFKQIWNMP